MNIEMKTTIILAVLTIFAIASAKPCIPRPPIHFDPYNVQHLNIGNGGDGGRGGWGGILGGDGGDGGDGGNFFYRMLKHRNYYEQPKLKYYSRFNFQPSLTSLQLGNGGDGGRGGFGKYYGGNGGNFNAILGGFKPFRLFTKRIMPNPCESSNTFFDVNIGNAAAGGTGGMGGVLGGMGGAGGNAADINGFIKTILQTPRSFKPNDRQKYYVGGRPLYDENGNFQYNIRNRFEPIYMTQEIPAILGEAGATSVDSVAAGASAVNTGVDATTTGVGLAGEGVGKGFHLISSVTNGFFNKPIYPYSKQDFVPIKYSDYSF